MGIAFFSLTFCDNPPKKSEKKEKPITQQFGLEWEILFDGSNTDAWHLYNREKDKMSKDWHIEGNALVFDDKKPSQTKYCNKKGVHQF